MSRKVRITIEGWRPWSKFQRSGIGVNMEGLANVRYLHHLKLALKALYYHEEAKVEELQGKKFCKCETAPDLIIEVNPPVCGRCDKEIPPVPRWKEKPCQSTLIAAEIPAVTADTNSKPTSLKTTTSESAEQSAAPSAEKN